MHNSDAETRAVEKPWETLLLVFFFLRMRIPSNGLPVFHLDWRNDDGGPGYGADSKLDFVAPADGDFVLHLKDLRARDGPEFAYRLTIRDEPPRFQLRAEPENLNLYSILRIAATNAFSALRLKESTLTFSTGPMLLAISISTRNIYKNGDMVVPDLFARVTIMDVKIASLRISATTLRVTTWLPAS